MKKDKPRWKPTFAPRSEHRSVDVFLGYANDLDIWCDPTAFEVYIVGPESKLIRLESRCNFDVLKVVDDNLTPRAGSQDLHIDVHDMCLIYALCVEKGVIKNDQLHQQDQLLRR
jgi:hypothetical protein